MIIVVAFVITWIETWFLDFKVLPSERKERERGMEICDKQFFVIFTFSLHFRQYGTMMSTVSFNPFAAGYLLVCSWVVDQCYACSTKEILLQEFASELLENLGEMFSHCWYWGVDDLRFCHQNLFSLKQLFCILCHQLLFLIDNSP